MKRFLDQLIELLRESVIIQGIMSLAVIVIIGHAAFTHAFSELPKEFWLVSGTIVGYYFKAKNDNQVRKLARMNDEVLRQVAQAIQPTCDRQK